MTFQFTVRRQGPVERDIDVYLTSIRHVQRRVRYVTAWRLRDTTLVEPADDILTSREPTPF